MPRPLPVSQNAPSGIAQLRKSSEQNAQHAHQVLGDDHMNLDDFLEPTSIGSPAGVSPSPTPSGSMPDGDPSSTVAVSAIPIKQQQRLQADELSAARASAPSVPPLEQNRTSKEFAYVQRHVRKTSIDERRVCAPVFPSIAYRWLTMYRSLPSGALKPRPKSPQCRTAPLQHRTPPRKRLCTTIVWTPLSLRSPARSIHCSRSIWTPLIWTATQFSTLLDLCSRISPSPLWAPL